MQLIVTGFGVPTYIAPSPVQVLQVFVEQGDVLWINFWPTLLEAMAGFVLGNTIAVLLAVWFVHNQLAERAFYPIAVFINTIPIIAVAPILVLMLGNGYAPKTRHCRPDLFLSDSGQHGARSESGQSADAGADARPVRQRPGKFFGRSGCKAPCRFSSRR